MKEEHKNETMSVTLGLSVNEEMKDFIRLGRNETVVMHIGTGIGIGSVSGLSGSLMLMYMYMYAIRQGKWRHSIKAHS